MSVVIATYNWSNVLAHAVRSALAQSYPALEVIVVGDGCSDDTEAVVRRVADPRVRFENLPRNSGHQSAPNNRGIELASGEYVAYLGHDDLWHRDHLTHLVSTLQRRDVGLAVAATLALGPPGSGLRALLTTLPTTPSAVIHRRDAVERAGWWPDFRTLVEQPQVAFFGAVAACDGVASSNALTVWKFNSAWRPGSYRLRRDDEQAGYAPRIAGERFLVERELAGWMRARLGPGRVPLPDFDQGPTPLPPGWYVRQYRRVRGLPELPEG